MKGVQMNNWTKWDEKTRQNAKDCYESFISSLIEIALLRISKDPEYKDICFKGTQDDIIVDKILKKAHDDDKLFIRRYIESLSMKTNMEMKECYIQGIIDGINLIIHILS